MTNNSKIKNYYININQNVNSNKTYKYFNNFNQSIENSNQSIETLNLNNHRTYSNLQVSNSFIQEIMKGVKFFLDYFLKPQQLTFSETYCDGTATMEPGVMLPKNSDPSIAINYWSKKGLLKPNSFVYPKAENGKSLGAWPSNYAEIETKLTNYNTYDYGFMWPATPENDEYRYVYEHNGIDIMGEFGSPIYAPISGTLIYSEWGHTPNQRSHETPYSVSIKLDTPIQIDGKNVDTVFLTHMSGIRYNQEEIKNGMRIEQGELIGFMGNGAGSPNDGTVNWGPHLHMTFYDSSIGFDNGSISTETMEQIYNIEPGDKRNAGE